LRANTEIALSFLEFPKFGDWSVVTDIQNGVKAKTEANFKNLGDYPSLEAARKLGVEENP